MRNTHTRVHARAHRTRWRRRSSLRGSVASRRTLCSSSALLALFFSSETELSHPHMCVHACTCWTWARYEGIIKEKLKGFLSPGSREVVEA